MRLRGEGEGEGEAEGSAAAAVAALSVRGLEAARSTSQPMGIEVTTYTTEEAMNMYET